MNITGVVLAGAPNDGPMRHIAPVANEALIPVAGRPLVDYVVSALRDSVKISRIVVVGDVEEFAAALDLRGVEVIQAGGSVVDNLRRGREAAGLADYLLFTTADLPFLTGEVVDHFIGQCLKDDCGFYYPAVHRQTMEEAFPGVKRTFASLRDGVFTGGNCVLATPESVDRLIPLVQRFFAARKNVFQLASLLGPLFILRLLTRSITLAQLERKFAGLVGLRGRAVITPHAEIGFDVDKPDHLEAAERILEQNPPTGR